MDKTRKYNEEMFLRRAQVEGSEAAGDSKASKAQMVPMVVRWIQVHKMGR